MQGCGKGLIRMARTITDKLRQMDASEKKNRESIRAYVDRESYRSGEDDRRGWMLSHYEMRLAELMANRSRKSARATCCSSTPIFCAKRMNSTRSLEDL